MSKFKEGNKISAMINGAHRVAKIVSVNDDHVYTVVPRFFNDSGESFEIAESDIFGLCALVPSDDW